MKTKKIISFILVAVMLFTAIPFAVSAESAVPTATQNTYVPDYDTETPVVLIHGIGMNDTYVLDEDGNRKVDKNGKYITGWPLSLDIMALVKDVLPSLLMSVLTRKDSGLSEAMKKGAYDLLYTLHKDSEGNYLNEIEVPCFKGPFSEMEEDFKQMCYKYVPVYECADIIGEESMYYFGYDSFGDIETTARQLHEFITETVLPQTGSDKVSICPMSLGATVAVQYMDMYKEDLDLIKKIAYVVPAIDGSDIVGDLLIGNISIEDDEVLYYDFFTKLIGDTYLAHLINMLIRILPNHVMKSALHGLVEGAVQTLCRSTTQIWALCPDAYYEQAKEIWLADEDYALIAEKVDNYMTARKNFRANTNTILANGGRVYNMVCYNLENFPITKEYNVKNSDGIIQCVSTSMGATFANLGETLGEGYVAAGTNCNNPAHNHLSPDGVVDATTGFLPCTTWYFEGQYHADFGYNDVCLALTTRLMTDDNMIDVYSNPAAFPQFNGARSTRYQDIAVKAYDEFDKSQLSAEEIAACEAAIAAYEAEKANTVIDEEKWEQVSADLNAAMIAAGVIEDDSPSFIENAFSAVTRTLNKGVNKVLNK